MQKRVLAFYQILHRDIGRYPMIRTQIQLTEEQNNLLRELSKTTREPIAALIRKAVDQFLLTR